MHAGEYVGTGVKVNLIVGEAKSIYYNNNKIIIMVILLWTVVTLGGKCGK